MITGGLLSLTSLGILYYIGRSVSPVTKFLYANARIQARSGYLIQEKNMDNLINAKTLNELMNSLRETDYIEELEKIQKKDDIKMFHKAVEKSFLGSILELKEMSPDKAKEVLDAYIGMLEAKVLKTVFRARLGNEELDESLVFSVGVITPEVLLHLKDTKTVADISVVMSTTDYSVLFAEKYVDVEQFDVAIENFVLKNMIATVEKVKMHDSTAIIAMIMAKMDLMNLLALLKFKVRQLDPEQQIKLLIPTETPLGKRLGDLVKAEDLKKMISLCNNLDYHEALEKAFAEYEKDGSMMHFEQKLLRQFKKSVVSKEMAHTLGPYPLFSYLIKKEIEMRNLFVISSGIANGFESERIKRLVI